VESLIVKNTLPSLKRSLNHSFVPMFFCFVGIQLLMCVWGSLPHPAIAHNPEGCDRLPNDLTKETCAGTTDENSPVYTGLLNEPSYTVFELRQRKATTCLFSRLFAFSF